MNNKRINKKAVALVLLLGVALLLMTGCMASGNMPTGFKASKSIWSILAMPMGYLMAFFDKLNMPYVITLLCFAFVMKIVLFPFGIKQQKNMVKQASLRPKEAVIRKKYNGRTDKDAKQQEQQEIMDLYQKEGYNPMGGCLPLLIQMPILFALFEVVYNPLRYIAHLSIDSINAIATKLTEMGITLKAGRYDLYVLDQLSKLSNKDYSAIQKTVENLPAKAELPDLTLFGLDLAGEPSKIGGWYLLIPALTFVIVYLTTLLTKKMTYQAQPTGDAKTSGMLMDIVMPAMSAFFAYSFPAILGIYWMFQNIFGVLQQIILKKMYPIPVFTEEDFAAAEKEFRRQGKSNNKKRKTAAKRHPNSLHHIDDDDDDVPPPAPKAPKPKAEKAEKGAQSDNGSIIEPAPLKDDTTDKN